MNLHPFESTVAMVTRDEIWIYRHLEAYKNKIPKIIKKNSIEYPKNDKIK